MVFVVVQGKMVGRAHCRRMWYHWFTKGEYFSDLPSVFNLAFILHQIIEFPPNQRPATHLTLSQEPPPVKGARGAPGQSQKPYAITSVSWAPSCGRSYHLVATGSRDCLVRIWKIKPPKQVGAVGDDGQWTATLVEKFDDHEYVYLCLVHLIG